MQSIARIGRLVQRLNRARLVRALAVVFTALLVISTSVSLAEAHMHSVLSDATVETVPANAPGSGQADVCPVCHAHCGCHLGLAWPEVSPASIIRVPRPFIHFGRDETRRSMVLDRLTPPPKA